MVVVAVVPAAVRGRLEGGARSGCGGRPPAPILPIAFPPPPPVGFGSTIECSCNKLPLPPPALALALPGAVACESPAIDEQLHP